jgi:hypothetical protein
MRIFKGQVLKLVYPAWEVLKALVLQHLLRLQVIMAVHQLVCLDLLQILN